MGTHLPDPEGGDEYFQFRFHLLQVALVVAVAFSCALVVAQMLGLNDQGPIHRYSLAAFFVTALALTLYLRGRKDRFVVASILFFTAWYLVSLSALYFLQNNEFRPIWFFVLITVVYIILGPASGLATTALTFVVFIVANPYLMSPFSGNAMVTLLFSLCAVNAFLYSYAKRFVSYHRRLVTANELLRDLSGHDPLTGVSNTRALYDDCDILIRNALRTGTPVSVLFIDLDHFKAINDHHGHEVGDVVLKEVATCLAQNMRESDLFGRVGGEEFLALLPNTNLAGAKLLAEKLRQLIENLKPSVGKKRIPVTISIGVAENRPEHRTIADIRREADQAMYRAKDAGRNRVATLPDDVDVFVK